MNQNRTAGVRIGDRRGPGVGLAAVLGAALLAAGCAALPGGGHATVSIDTTPEGATAFADGRRLGVTPLTVVRDEAFPPRWHDMEYRVSGTLTLRKAGCRPEQVPVSDPVLSHPVHVRLHCDAQAGQTPSPSSGAPAGGSADAPASAPAGGPTARGSAEQRLQRLRRLHDQGLVTDGEYRRIRQRILNSL